MKYEIITHDGKTYAINQDDPKIIAKLASKLELVPVTLASGRIEYFAKGNVARIQQASKPVGDVCQLQSGDTNKRADGTGPGYKKYVEARERFMRNDC